MRLLPAEVADDLLAPGAPCDTKQDGSEWLEGGARQQRDLGSTKRRVVAWGQGWSLLSCIGLGRGEAPAGTAESFQVAATQWRLKKRTEHNLQWGNWILHMVRPACIAKPNKHECKHNVFLIIFLAY